MAAPALRGKWVWADPGRCWWREKGIRSREHPIKKFERGEELWKRVADIFGPRETGEKGRSVLESRSAGAKLGSAVIGELLGNEACKKAVLAFLEHRSRERQGRGFEKDENVDSSFLSFLFPFFLPLSPSAVYKVIGEASHGRKSRGWRQVFELSGLGCCHMS